MRINKTDIKANMSRLSKSELLEKAILYLYDVGLSQLQLADDQRSESKHTGMSNSANELDILENK